MRDQEGALIIQGFPLSFVMFSLIILASVFFGTCP